LVFSDKELKKVQPDKNKAANNKEIMIKRFGSMFLFF